MRMYYKKGNGQNSKGSFPEKPNSIGLTPLISLELECNQVLCG